VRLSRGYGERHRPGLAGEDLVVRVDQLDPYLVRARRHPGEVDRVDVARIRPPPGQVVYVHVQMPDPWRGIQRALPEYWQDVHVLHSPLDPDDAPVEQVGKRVIHDQLWRRFVLEFGVRRRTANLFRTLSSGQDIGALDVCGLAMTTPTTIATANSDKPIGFMRLFFLERMTPDARSGIHQTKVSATPSHRYQRLIDGSPRREHSS